LAVEALPAIEAEAKGRQGIRTDIVPKTEQSHHPKSVEVAGQIFGVSGRMVSDAKG